ncbi:MAG: multidrug transporter AcrB [Planctomycetota bacterium]
MALLITPREEDPQIVVPLADVFVAAPGLSAAEIEQQVTTPLERILYQIDGVEYVYSMSRPDSAIVTVRFYVGEDRERALVRLFKKLEESKDLIPPHVLHGGGWIMKPVEIDDVPIVTLTLRSARPEIDEFALRRVGEELAQRLASVPDTSRVTVHGGLPRVVRVEFDREALRSRRLAMLEVKAALQAANVLLPAGPLQRDDASLDVRAGNVLSDARAVGDVVVGVFEGRPVRLGDVARVLDGPDERTSIVRHGWGPASNPLDSAHHENRAGTTLYPEYGLSDGQSGSAPAVTIAIAKKKGTNAVNTAEAVIAEARRLAPLTVPGGMELVITRNSGLTADEKVNELVEGLWVAIIIVIGLLTIGLGWREALVVAVAVPVVFGLTLAVNLLAGYTINRVTLFALILALGLLVDDPIVDVENIARHFSLRRKATRDITLAAVSEIRPPLISATLAVIASFLPLFFITGMMGPYMRPMALNVPVTMVMSMVVAFTITPWLAFHLLKKRNWARGGGHGEDEFAAARESTQYRLLTPILRPLLTNSIIGRSFLVAVGLLTVAAAMLAGMRMVPLKMLPFDNKSELLLALNMDEGTSLERTDAVVRALEEKLRGVPEVTDFASYVGEPSPIDFNGLVRHYYLRRGTHYAEIRLGLVDKKSRVHASHTLGLRLRDELTTLAAERGGRLKIVELPPGPPVIDTIAAEVYGTEDLPYARLCDAAELVTARLAREPGVVEADDTVEARRSEWVFTPDQEKAALSGVSVAEIAATLRIALNGEAAGIVHAPSDRQPLSIVLRLPIEQRADRARLSDIHVKGQTAAGPVLVSLAELGRWEERPAQQTIYHKNLRRVAYAFAEVAGRPPADAVVDVMADQTAEKPTSRIVEGPGGWISTSTDVGFFWRSHLSPGGGVPWNTIPGTKVVWSGEGEWKITLDVFRDLGLAFAGALVCIYIILVAQTGSFLIPVIVMLSIPLTMLGIMPGFWLLGLLSGGAVGGYADPAFFTATAMIGMIALSGIVTRQSIILVDFIHLALRRGRPLLDAVIESGVVRLRPILLVVLAAMLSAIPITIDPIFSGLAWALIFGLIASTLFTLFVVPLVYYMLYRNVPGHGVAEVA